MRAPRADGPRSAPASGATIATPSSDPTEIARCDPIADAARGIEATADRRIDEAFAPRAAHRARLPLKGLRATFGDDSAEALAPRAVSIAISTCSPTRYPGPSPAVRERRMLVRSSSRAGGERLATRPSTTASGSSAAAAAAPRPRRRDDLVAALETTEDAAHRRAESTRLRRRGRRYADVPRVRERHAPSQPGRIGLVDQYGRAAGECECMRDGRADIRPLPGTATTGRDIRARLEASWRGIGRAGADAAARGRKRRYPACRAVCRGHATGV